MKLKINSSLNVNENFNIKFYYTNDVINFSDFQKLEDNLKIKILKLGENLIEPGLVEIFGYDYNIGESIDKEISISINLDINDENEKSDKNNEASKILIIIFIIIGALILIAVLIFIILKLKKKNSSVKIEEVDSTELITS